jgi:hypothetical protein
MKENIIITQKQKKHSGTNQKILKKNVPKLKKIKKKKKRRKKG